MKKIFFILVLLSCFAAGFAETGYAGTQWGTHKQNLKIGDKIEPTENELWESTEARKKLILNKVSKTNLNVYSTNNYSSILVELDKDIDINLLKKELSKNKIKLNFINDFMDKKVNNEILIIGFSSIDINLIDKGFDLIIDSINNSLKKNN